MYAFSDESVVWLKLGEENQIKREFKEANFCSVKKAKWLLKVWWMLAKILATVRLDIGWIKFGKIGNFSHYKLLLLWYTNPLYGKGH